MQGLTRTLSFGRSTLCGERRHHEWLAVLFEGTQSTSLQQPEERPREASYRARRGRPPGAPSYDLRVGDLRTIWDGLPDGSIGVIVTDPPRNEGGIRLYGDLARLAARVLKPGRRAAVYCGHVCLDEEMRLLEEGGLGYVWHDVNPLNGPHARIWSRTVNGHHLSVLLFSAG